MKLFVILTPYTFTEFDYYKYELSFLKKEYNCKIIVHDLSNIVSNRNLNSVWRTPRCKKAKIFYSFFSWLKEFNKIKKNSNSVVYNLIDLHNFSSFLIKLTLISSKLKILIFSADEVPYWKPKKNIIFFLKKILNHKLNYKLYLFNLNHVFFKKLFNLFKIKNFYLLTINREIFSNEKKYKKIIKCNSQDYSNLILYKKKFLKVKKSKERNYIIYIDNGGPYFSGDALLNYTKLPENNTELFYNKLNNFFDRIELFFNKKIIIIPHRKYKVPKLKNKNLITYFQNRVSNNSYDALPKLIINSLFVMSRGSTAIGYAIASYKPIQLIYSSTYNYVENELKDLRVQARVLGTNLIDIDYFDQNKIVDNLVIKKNKYNIYKKKYLVSKNNYKPNYKIIGDFFENL